MTENWQQDVRNKNRDELITVAKELFMKESFLTVNIKEICSQAGVSRVTFYKHFQSIHELVFEVQIGILQNMTDYICAAPAAGMNGRDMLAAMLDAWVDYAVQYPGYIRFILLFDLHYEAYVSSESLRAAYDAFIGREKEQHFLMEALQTGAADGSLQTAPEPLETAHFIFTSMLAFLQKMCISSRDGGEAGIQEITMAGRFAGMLVQHLSVS